MQGAARRGKESVVLEAGAEGMSHRSIIAVPQYPLVIQVGFSQCCCRPYTVWYVAESVEGHPNPSFHAARDHRA